MPTVEYCDSMGQMFEGNSKAFAGFAKIDYDILIEAYGQQNWDLTDPEKKPYVARLKGGLVCFCFLMNELINTNK